MGVLRLPKILLQPVVASRSDTTAVSIVFVLSPLRPPAVTRHPSPRAGSCSTGLPPVPLTVETSGSPRFLGSHTYRSAPLLDPGRASLPGLLSAVPFCPRFNNHEGPFDLPRFRGSLTRLSGSLSTLPRLRYLRRARLASGWWPTSFRVGLVTHMAPLKGFRSVMSSHGITSSFPRFTLAPCLSGERKEKLRVFVRVGPGAARAATPGHPTDPYEHDSCIRFLRGQFRQFSDRRSERLGVRAEGDVSAID